MNNGFISHVLNERQRISGYLFEGVITNKAKLVLREFSIPSGCYSLAGGNFNLPMFLRLSNQSKEIVSNSAQ